MQGEWRKWNTVNYPHCHVRSSSTFLNIQYKIETKYAPYLTIACPWAFPIDSTMVSLLCIIQGTFFHFLRLVFSLTLILSPPSIRESGLQLKPSPLNVASSWSPSGSACPAWRGYHLSHSEFSRFSFFFFLLVRNSSIKIIAKHFTTFITVWVSLPFTEKLLSWKQFASN